MDKIIFNKYCNIYYNTAIVKFKFTLTLMDVSKKAASVNGGKNLTAAAVLLINFN